MSVGYLGTSLYLSTLVLPSPPLGSEQRDQLICPHPILTLRPPAGFQVSQVTLPLPVTQPFSAAYTPELIKVQNSFPSLISPPCSHTQLPPNFSFFLHAHFPRPLFMSCLHSPTGRLPPDLTPQMCLVSPGGSPSVSPERKIILQL